MLSIDAELAAFRLTDTQKSNQQERSTAEILGVVERLLWDSAAPLNWSRRLRLQALWLYQKRFLTQVTASTTRGDSRASRLIGGLAVEPRPPKLVLAKSYRQRILGVGLSAVTKLVSSEASKAE